jgi:hypothetical protein
MKLVKMPLSVAFAASLVAACSGAAEGDSFMAVPALNAEADGGASSDSSAREPADDVPHALGTIVLGEAHAAGASSTSPIVSVTFVPDAKKATACHAMLEGCELSLAPKCTETTTPTGCAEGKACSFDEACAPVCANVPVCGEACAKDETCTSSAPGASAGTCKRREAFDAGPVAFSGTTTPLTLYPPYSFDGDGKGAPFLAGSAIRVQASGAAQAGFAAFDETFTATTFLQTTPSLGAVARESVFGTGPLTLSWVPGKDTVVVTVSGPSGSATCKAPDEAGTIRVPRAVIDRVLVAGMGAPGSATLGLAIARERKETKKGKEAKGTLSNQPVQSVAWLDLVTTSSESATFQGCAAGATACLDACVDTKTDKLNCGGCGAPCGSTQQCAQGKCVAAGCVLGPENTVAACSDGCSNDGDPYIDCDDYDCCPLRKDCPVTTACGKNK